jgi:polar amino acid transport system permease protein
LTKPRLPFVRSTAIVLAALALSGCAGGYQWAWDVVLPLNDQGRQHFSFLIAGFVTTFELAGLALLFGLIIGVVMALLARSNDEVLVGFVRIYVGLLRAVPTFVLLLWVYYTVPILAESIPPAVQNVPGLYYVTHLSPMTAAAITLALSSGAFLSEILRAGIDAVPKGQIEAARSLGMSRAQTMRRIVLPQGLRRMIPPIGSQFIQTIKDSALASAIGLQELTRRASELQVQTYRPLETYTFLALEYISIVLVLTWIVHRLERRLRID